ncbi:MAG: M23 family metallopeptidase [Candidatus Shapirobacteria bacterium]
MKEELELIKEFWKEQGKFFGDLAKSLLGWAGVIKVGAAKLMYRQRGKFSGTFVHVSMAILSFLAIVFSGTIEELIAANEGKETAGSGYLLATEGGGGADTQISNLPKGEITEYRVLDGDTVSSIAQKFGVNIDTVIWENNLKSADAIKPKQILRILPVVGVKYKVKRGETIYSIAKAHQVDAQNIIDYPFNTFADDESFALTAGQELIIPEGIKPKEIVVDVARYAAKTVAPIPGVVGEGNFMWPTSGTITQRFYWYHQATDIANHAGPDVVASQGGTVTAAGWSGGGYGNYVMIDHGNGYKTLYGHLVTGSIVVEAGQTVKQGKKLGRMGSTGRSTGIHLHFEIFGPSGKLDPLTVLK